MRPATLYAADAAALAHDGWRDLAQAMAAPVPPVWGKLHPDRRYAAVAAACQAHRGADDRGWHASYTGYLREAGWNDRDDDLPEQWAGLLVAWERLGRVALACVRYQWATVRAAGRLEGYRPVRTGGWVGPQAPVPVAVGSEAGCTLVLPRQRADLHPQGGLVAPDVRQS